MARPVKKGLSYFPLDVHAFEDPKLEGIQYEFGPLGAFVYIRILTLVYDEGYYLELSAEQLAYKIHKSIGSHWVRLPKILDIIHACVELGLLERAFFLQGVITSVSIQKQYVLSTRRRKNINMDKYCLLDSETQAELGVLLSMGKSKDKTVKKVVNVNNNSINVDRSTQSKNKKKSKKDKEIIIDKSIYGAPKMHYITKLLISRKYIHEFDGDVIKYNTLFEISIQEYGYENVLSGVNYIISYSRNPNPKIDDKYAFMNKSLINNLEKFRKQESKGSESFEEWIKRNFL